jgi:hypothetical protein
MVRIPTGEDTVSDDLTDPVATVPRATGGRPWRPFSLLYVALLGGSLAVTAIAYLDAGRFGAGPRERRLILVAGALAFLATVPLAVFVVAAMLHDAAGGIRFALRAPAVVAALAQVRTLGRLDRMFRAQSGQYGSLWLPGFLAVFLGGVGEAVAIFALVLAIS